MVAARISSLDGGISWSASRPAAPAGTSMRVAATHRPRPAGRAGERSSIRTDGNADLGVRLEHWVIGAQEREGQVSSKPGTWCRGPSPLQPE